MGNVADPRDDAIVDLQIARKRAEAAFAADGVIDENEALSLRLMDSGIATVSSFRLREKAADAFVKIGVNKYVRTLFKDADAAISDLPGNVIAFPEHSPLDAA